MKLRPATMDDWARLFAMRNDETTRLNSCEGKPVALDEHLQWLTRTLADENTSLFIAKDDYRGVTVGFARLDYTTEQQAINAICSLAVDAPQRGRGYAQQLIQALAEKAKTKAAARLTAVVRPSNYPSLRAFASCGFSILKTDGVLVTLGLELS